MNGLNGRVDGLEMKKGKWEKDVGYLTRWAKGPANFLQCVSTLTLRSWGGLAGPGNVRETGSDTEAVDPGSTADFQR